MDDLYTDICVPLVHFLSTSDPKHVAIIRRFIYATMHYQPPPCLDDLPPHFRIFCHHFAYDSYDTWERSCIMGAITAPPVPPPAALHVFIDGEPVFYHPLTPAFLLYLHVRPDAPFKMQLFRYDTDELIRPDDYCFTLTQGERLRAIKFFD